MNFSRLLTAVSDFVQELERLQAENETLRKERDEANATLMAPAEPLLIEANEVEREEHEPRALPLLARALDYERADHAKTRQALAELQKRVDSAKEECKRLQTENATLRNERDEMEAERDEAEAERDEMEVERDEALDDLSYERADHAKTHQALAELQKRVDRAQAILSHDTVMRSTDVSLTYATIGHLRAILGG